MISPQASGGGGGGETLHLPEEAMSGPVCPGQPTLLISGESGSGFPLGKCDAAELDREDIHFPAI